MLHIKAKKITLPLFISVLSALFYPALTQAEPYGTGDISATRAAEQRAALAKKAEKRKQEAEAKKAAEAQQGQPAEAATPAPAEVQQEKPAAQ
jgi:hypothetical protein